MSKQNSNHIFDSSSLAQVLALGENSELRALNLTAHHSWVLHTLNSVDLSQTGKADLLVTALSALSRESTQLKGQGNILRPAYYEDPSNWKSESTAGLEAATELTIFANHTRSLSCLSTKLAEFEQQKKKQIKAFLTTRQEGLKTEQKNLTASRLEGERFGHVKLQTINQKRLTELNHAVQATQLFDTSPTHLGDGKSTKGQKKGTSTSVAKAIQTKGSFWTPTIAQLAQIQHVYSTRLGANEHMQAAVRASIISPGSASKARADKYWTERHWQLTLDDWASWKAQKEDQHRSPGDQSSAVLTGESK